MAESLDAHSFGARLKVERGRLGLSQAEAAERCGVRREMWGKYERGVAMPSFGVVERFAAHGADVLYLITGNRNPSVYFRDPERDPVVLVLRGITDSLGIDIEAVRRLIKTVEQMVGSDLLKLPHERTEEIRRLAWHLLSLYGVQSGDYIVGGEGRCDDYNLLCNLIQRFETSLQHAQEQGVALSPRSKARAIAMLYRDARKRGYVDGQMVSDALRLAGESDGS